MLLRTCRRLIVLACVVAAVHFGILEANGQSQSGQRQYSKSLRNRPTVSPYTSLINTGGAGVDNGSLSFYNIVRPQQRAQKVARSLGSELETVESKIKKLKKGEGEQSSTNAEALNTGRMTPTGHRVQFGELSSHYSGTRQSK